VNGIGSLFAQRMDFANDRVRAIGSTRDEFLDDPAGPSGRVAGIVKRYDT
jgi:hypothetical protein